MKRFSLLGLSFLVIFCLNSCSFDKMKNIENCTFSLSSISELLINDIEFDGKKSFRDFSPSEVAVISKGLMSEMPIEFTANIQIDNPNAKDAELCALEWVLFIKDIEIANGILDDKTEIKAHSSTLIPIEVETNSQILKNFSLTEIKNIIFTISRTKKLPPDAVLKVKPAFAIGKNLIKLPTFITINNNK